MNKLITANNVEIGSLELHKLVCEYYPSYIYRNVKTQKPNALLFLVISQIPTPVYHLVNTLNELLLPYLDSKYNIYSTNKFLTI